MVILGGLLLVVAVIDIVVALRRLRNGLRVYVEVHKALPPNYRLFRRNSDGELERQRRLQLAALGGFALFLIGTLFAMGWFGA